MEKSKKKKNSNPVCYTPSSEHFRISLSNSSTSPSSTYPYIPLQSSIHSVHMNVDNNNHVIVFANDKCLGLSDNYQTELQDYNSRQKDGRNSFPPSMGLFSVTSVQFKRSSTIYTSDPENGLQNSD
jgi:hypothetical protein